MPNNISQQKQASGFNSNETIMPFNSELMKTHLKTEIWILLINIKNAFGRQLQGSINCSQAVRPHPHSSQSKTGCPFSGPTDNISVNPLYPQIQALRKKLHLLEYADDTVAIEDSPEALLAILDVIVELARKLGLQLNAEKCKSIHRS